MEWHEIYQDSEGWKTSKGELPFPTFFLFSFTNPEGSPGFLHPLMSYYCSWFIKLFRFLVSVLPLPGCILCLSDFFLTLYHSAFFFFFLRLHMQHMKVPRIGFESELYLLAYATATATPNPSCIYDLCCSLWEHWTLNLLSEARDQTYILRDTVSGS